MMVWRWSDLISALSIVDHRVLRAMTSGKGLELDDCDNGTEATKRSTNKVCIVDFPNMQRQMLRAN